jgi:hypothetical protein
MKKIIIVIFVLVSSIQAQSQFAEISSLPGAFSRMGFGARGMGMANAMSAIKDGNLVSYYNPALVVFQEGNSFQTSYSMLSLDRHLNFLNFTKRFQFGKKEMSDGTIVPKSIAGFSVGLINSGVSNIDGRDYDGTPTGNLSTSENQFFVAVANKFSDKFAIGIAFKFYYYKLVEDVKASGVGLDVGAIYSISDAMALSFVVTDLNSKYEWDTGNIYGSSGSISKDKFPLLKKIGISYKFDDPKIIAAVEFESSNAGTNYLRFAGEYNIFENLFLRGGLDRLNFSNFDFPVRPSFGLSYFYTINSIKFGFDYAFVFEPYSSSDQHIVGINVNF